MIIHKRSKAIEAPNPTLKGGHTYQVISAKHSNDIRIGRVFVLVEKGGDTIITYLADSRAGGYTGWDYAHIIERNGLKFEEVDLTLTTNY